MKKITHQFSFSNLLLIVIAGLVAFYFVKAAPFLSLVAFLPYSMPYSIQAELVFIVILFVAMMTLIVKKEVGTVVMAGASICVLAGKMLIFFRSSKPFVWGEMAIPAAILALLVLHHFVKKND